MRLDDSEKETILSVVNDIFGESEVCLFGSRLDSAKKGGDIDLFVIAKDRSNLFEKKIKALSRLERLLCKPVDIVVHKRFDRAIEQEILKTGVEIRPDRRQMV